MRKDELSLNLVQVKKDIDFNCQKNVLKKAFDSVHVLCILDKIYCFVNVKINQIV